MAIDFFMSSCAEEDSQSFASPPSGLTVPAPVTKLTHGPKLHH